MQIQAATPAGQAQDFINAMAAIGQAHERGIAFALNGVSKDAYKKLRRAIWTSVDEPVPFTLKAVYATGVDLKKPGGIKLDEIFSAVGMLPDQSAYLKYLMGDGPTIRKPGDIGPADKHIYVPIWASLIRTQGIKPVAGGNLPRNTLAKLARKAGRTIGTATTEAAPAEPTKGKRRRKSPKGEIFWGTPKFHGERQGLGFWWRPPRGNGAPEMLVAAVDQSKHKPILARRWQEAIEDAWGRFPGLLELELRLKTEHLMKKRAAKAQATTAVTDHDFFR